MLAKNMGPGISVVREEYIKHKTEYDNGLLPIPFEIDLRGLKPGFISTATLTALLSVCYNLRKTFGQPIPAWLDWNPEVQRFLASLRFFQLANSLKIFKWLPGEEIIGGYTVSKIQESSTIVVFTNSMNYDDIKDRYAEVRRQLWDQIAPRLAFNIQDLVSNLREESAGIITNATLELIINGLIHGESETFVGIQRRSRTRLTVTVCDSGIGFPLSLAKTTNDILLSRKENLEGILYGCLATDSFESGLTRAIESVLNYKESYNQNYENEGYVVVSSFDAEVRWQKYNWERAKQITLEPSNNLQLKNNLAKIKRLRFDQSEGHETGYFLKYADNVSIKGTRITFEIGI
ncbi:hypothetical protein [Dyadobacter frigoris]|uniref:Uncharacterized protein n=1 Tax=Dyadobacter frigoris TaxID=2576211 RepID=A0A4U6D7C8_9BACT|nr:hypothetical protein [Dyadobacter frigoris]TKT92666.1 hypothetical protein FDK13_07575 [Dyadobacter frigoris]